MKKKLLFGVYAAIWLLLVCWLAVSNQVIQRMSGNLPVRKVSLEDYPHKDEVRSWVDEVSTLSDLYETMNIVGWAFVPTQQENPEAYTELILVGEKQSYAMRARDKQTDTTAGRPDVVEAHPDLSIPNDDVGFSSGCCGFEIPDGEYDIYVYRWENEENYGLGYSRARFSKDDGNVRLWYVM